MCDIARARPAAPPVLPARLTKAENKGQEEGAKSSDDAPPPLGSLAPASLAQPARAPGRGGCVRGERAKERGRGGRGRDLMGRAGRAAHEGGR